MRSLVPVQAPTCRHLLVAVLLVAAPVAVWLARGPQPPDGNFVLLSKLPDSPVADDLSHRIYGLARTPAYELLGWLFEHPAAFWLGGIASHALFNLALYALALVGSRAARPARFSAESIAAMTTLAVFPCAFAARWVSEGITLVPHDAFHTFSFRTLAFALVAAAYRELELGRPRRVLWLLAASCIVHPTLGWLAFALFGSAALALARPRHDARIAVHAGAAALFAAAPALAQRSAAAAAPGLDATLGLGDWYSRMIKDEADDFSFLFQLAAEPRATLYLLAVVAAALALAARLEPESRRSLAFRLASAIPLLFLAGALFEWVAAVWVPTPYVLPLVGLSAGYRLLSFAFFPLAVLGTRLVAVALDSVPWPPRRLRATAVAALTLGWTALALHGWASGRTSAAVSFARWALAAPPVDGVDAYLAAIERAGGDAFDRPTLVRCDGEPVIYPDERNVLRILAADRRQPRCVADRDSLVHFTAASFERLAGEVRRTVPSGAGLYVPPYVEYFRDALPNHRIFFQEQHDGNLMRGGPRFAAFWCARMRDLLGFDYEGMPSKASGLAATRLRDAYLALDGERLVALRRRYPEFRYLLTEAIHALPFAVVLAESGFFVYDLDAPAGPAAEG